MTLNSKALTVILLAVLFGGVALASAAGWWMTESSKIPVTFTEGDFAGQSNPADIRGSYTFGDISKSFAVSPEVLAQAFGVEGASPAAFAVKDLESKYLDSGYEIGTASIRLFVAYYTGLPFDTTDQEIYLPRTASNILLTQAHLTAPQLAYLEKYTVNLQEAPSAEQPVVAATTMPAAETSSNTDYTVKGKTTFGELITWGVPPSVIERLIGASMPEAAMTLKDYAAANNLNFETLKPAIQAEVDKVKP